MISYDLLQCLLTEGAFLAFLYIFHSYGSAQDIVESFVLLMFLEYQAS